MVALHHVILILEYLSSLYLYPCIFKVVKLTLVCTLKVVILTLVFFRSRYLHLPIYIDPCIFKVVILILVYLRS